MSNKIKQELERIEIPKELHERSKMGIKKAKSELERKNRKIIKGIGGIVAAAVLSIGLMATTSPSFASSLSKVPIIGSIFGNSDLIGLQLAHEKGLTSEIGETQSVNGISVTLDEILYNQNHITIGLIIESEKKLGEHYFGAGMDFTINGKMPKGSSGGYGEDIQSLTIRTAIQEINVKEEMPSAFELGLILHGENGEKWHFSTPVKQLAGVTQVPINHSENVEDIKFTVTELTIGETGLGIAYEASEEGTDYSLSLAKYIEFQMVDQDGNEITSHSGGVEGRILKNRMIFKSNKAFDPIATTVTELTITPHLKLPTGGGGVEVDGNGESKELEFKGDSLQSVEFESIKVKIPQ